MTRSQDGMTWNAFSVSQEGCQRIWSPISQISPTQKKQQSTKNWVNLFRPFYRPCFSSDLNCFEILTIIEKRATKRPHSVDDLTHGLSTVIKDFHVQLATPSDETCVCCFQKIGWREIQINKVISEENWNLPYHLKCFRKHSTTLGWGEVAESFPGFSKLPEEQKIVMRSHFEWVFLWHFRINFIVWILLLVSETRYKLADETVSIVYNICEQWMDCIDSRKSSRRVTD